MEILVGSYNKNIYMVKIDSASKKFLENKLFSNDFKPSYIINNDFLAYIYMKDNEQFLKVMDRSILLSNKSCHLSYDKKHNYIYTSHYHDGMLKIVDLSSKSVIKTLKHGESSHIHYAEYIETLSLLGVCDLGTNMFYLYDVYDNDLTLKSSISLNNKGPRHFVYNKVLPYIYIINEISPSITILNYSNNTLTIIDEINLSFGSGSAIRITEDNKMLYAAVRDSNFIFSFKIEKNGLLKLIQKVHTLGNHPRDFNLIGNDKLLVVANMKSNTLTLFENINSILHVRDYNYTLLEGATIVESKR